MLLMAAVLFATQLQNPFVVSTDWLAAHLDDPTIVVVEVGERSDYDAAHIPGARFIARADIVADCDGVPNELTTDETLVDAFTRAGVGESKRIIIYSRNPLVASRTWFTLDYLGHASRASLLDGGWEAWESEQRPATKVATRVSPAPFTAAIRPYSLVRLEEVRDLVKRRLHVDGLVIIDARPSLYFGGEPRGAQVERGGHIPDAVNVPWTMNLASEHPPRLRPQEELRRMYEVFGVTRDSIVVTYCRTGMEASMTYFVLRSLGYDPALYDGSFVEWSHSRETVVVTGISR